MGEEEATQATEAGRLSFYVLVGGSAREVLVDPDQGLCYPKTDAEHRAPNDLLALPRY